MSGPPSSEVPFKKVKQRGPKQKENLKFLRPGSDTEKPFPREVSQLLVFLDKEEERFAIASGTLKGKKAIFDQRLADAIASGDTAAQTENQGKIDETTELMNKNELRRNDLNGFRKLLFQQGDNLNVAKVSEQMNIVYGVLFETSPPSEFADADFNGKVKILLEGFGPDSVAKVHDEYITRNDKLDDALDAAQTDYIIELGRTNNPSTFLEAYVTSMDRYSELTDKILLLPKAERDKNVDELLKTVKFYESFTNGEFEKRVDAEMDGAVKEIFDKQESEFKGLRGMIQRGIEGGTDFAINHLSGFLGDKDSLARNVFVAAARMGQDLSKPVQYSPELVNKLKEETKAQLYYIGAVVDPARVELMKTACIDMKANPDRFVSDKDKRTFMDAFKQFLPVSTGLIERTVATQSDLIHNAYVLSHGKDSMFEGDNQLRAKFLSSEGRDLIRMARLYSPFGVFLPEKVELKDGKQLYLESAYHKGWFQEHPILSSVIQTGELTGLVVTAYGISRLAFATRIIGNVIKSVVGGSPLKKFVWPVTATILGYEIGTEINKYRVSEQERDIINKVKSYDSLAEIPWKDKEELRQLFLENELHKKRKLAQPIGHDLSKMNIDFTRRLKLGNVGQVGIRTSMVEDGSFREAVLSANRKLVLLGFEPYEIDKD